MFGMPAIPNDPAAPRPQINGNLSEVFLSLIDTPSQDMGAKGDQAGGVMRPATDLVAMSRLSGPVGIARRDNADQPVSYKTDERQLFHHTAALFDAATSTSINTPERAAPAVRR